ncbi:hypothetical protein D3C72_1408740 [compost metagenome]
MIRPPSISANRLMRTGMRSGSSQLVIHDVKIHTHQTAISSKPVCSQPMALRWASKPCDSCVTANTNTRSKNSSIMPTLPLSCTPRWRSREMRLFIFFLA